MLLSSFRLIFSASASVSEKLGQNLKDPESDLIASAAAALDHAILLSREPGVDIIFLCTHRICSAD